jgi:hypothetical protein
MARQSLSNVVLLPLATLSKQAALALLGLAAPRGFRLRGFFASQSGIVPAAVEPSLPAAPPSVKSDAPSDAP